MVSCDLSGGKEGEGDEGEKGQEERERENKIITPNIFFLKTFLQVKDATKMFKTVCSNKKYPCLLFGDLPTKMRSSVHLCQYRKKKKWRGTFTK